jgi:hypothetical protein
MPASGLQEKKQEQQAETFSYIDQPELMDRATDSWDRRVERLRAVSTQPISNLCETLVSDHTKHKYTIIARINGVQAVYTQPAGADRVMRLETWPEGLVS